MNAVISAGGITVIVQVALTPLYDAFTVITAVPFAFAVKTKIGDDEYYAQELFKDEELYGYFEHNMIASDRSVFEYVVFDSQNEERFAKRLEDNNDVKCYAKLPDWFKIATPLGSYNPDWAVLIEKDGEKKLYFVLETKGSIQFDMLRPAEHDKIHCGMKHFEALNNNVTYKAVDDFDKFIESI